MEKIIELRDTKILLSKLCYKSFKVDLSYDLIERIYVNSDECNYENKKSLSEWVEEFVENKGIFEDDIEGFVNFLNTANLREECDKGNTTSSYKYRRLVKGEYRWVKSEIMPASDFSMEHKKVIVFIIDIHDEYIEGIERENKQKKLLEAIENSFAAARNANDAKTEFLSRMSHDIRTPINAIMGLTQIAAYNIDNQNKVLDALNKISMASNHLLEIVNDVLDMSKIESGRMELYEEEINLSDVIQDLISMVKPQAFQKKHKLKVSVHNIIHENVFGDERRIKQAFINVLSNSIKYTPDGGIIRISVTEKEVEQANMACYEFVFEDNGIGMTEEYMEHIFEPFTRANTNGIENIQGTGLGMPITKNFVEMMNGHIDIESEIGIGTSVTIVIYLRLANSDIEYDKKIENIPVLIVNEDDEERKYIIKMAKSLNLIAEEASSYEEAISKISDRHKILDDYHFVMLDYNYSEDETMKTIRKIREKVGEDMQIVLSCDEDDDKIEISANKAGADACILKPLFKSKLAKIISSIFYTNDNTYESFKIDEINDSRFSGKKVLLAEDNELNKEVAGEILEMAGVDVDMVENGLDAVEKFRTSEIGYYKLIIMDIRMPVMNGYEATKKIRELNREDANTVPIIAMTANAFSEDIEKGKKSGMNEYISKPINVNKMFEVFRKWL